MFSSKVLAGLLPVLLVTGCASAPTVSATPTAASARVCLVTDSRGLADSGVNASAYSAIKEAVVSLGVEKLSKVLGSGPSAETAYAAINSMVRKGCGVIVSSGAILRTATIRAARANPDLAFVLVDDVVPSSSMEPLADNLKHLTFDAGQSAILAGYLAASNTKSGLVATFGSFDTPMVRASMQGFADGVQLFNSDTDSNVVTLGEQGNFGKRSLLGSSSSQLAAKKLTQNFFAQGADIVFPVAGAASLGAGLATVGQEGKYVIGFDRDWYLDSANLAWRSHVLASTLKQVSRPILETIRAYVKSGAVGDPATNEFVGTLENGGISITEEHGIAFAPEYNSAKSQLVSKINSGQIPTPKGLTN
jgi:basic membrane protein A